jgi:hypothetical protein
MGVDRATADTRELCSKKLCFSKCEVFARMLLFTEMPEVFLVGLTVFLPEITLLGAFAKFRIAAIIVCPSTRMEQLSSHWTTFHEI